MDHRLDYFLYRKGEIMNKLMRWIFKKYFLKHLRVRWGSSPDVGAWADISLFGIVVSEVYSNVVDDKIRWTNPIT